MDFIIDDDYLACELEFSKELLIKTTKMPFNMIDIDKSFDSLVCSLKRFTRQRLNYFNEQLIFDSTNNEQIDYEQIDDVNKKSTQQLKNKHSNTNHIKTNFKNKYYN